MKPAQPHTPIDAMIRRYLQRQRSLGRGYAKEEWVLTSLHNFLKKARSADLDHKTFQEWCKSHEELTANVRRQRQRIARNFCLYRQRTEPNCFVPCALSAPMPARPAGNLWSGRGCKDVGSGKSLNPHGRLTA
jgi:integrase/recombinase XerD